MTKKSKFTNFLNNIKTYKEKTTVIFFKSGTSISTESEEVFSLDWTIPKWKINKIEFDKFKFKIELKVLENIFKNTQYLSPLTIDIWAKLQNTISYKVSSLEKVEKITKKK